MSNGFEPGKPAIIINSREPSLIGLGVELVTYVPPSTGYMVQDTRYIADKFPAWHVKLQYEVKLVRTNNFSGNKEVYYSNEIVISQKNLMPLKGNNFEKEEEKDVLLSLSD